MSIPFRVIDTGVRPGPQQIAFDQALTELHTAGRSPDTIRFLRFPPTVLVGRHQALRQVVNVAHCRANGIGLARRLTGGGAIYLDEGQVGWELVLSRRRLPMATLGDYTKAICAAVAHGLSKAFGIDARFRPRSDIEVAGRKLCGTGGYFDGDTLIYQGTVLVDVEPARLLACLNVPRAAEPAAADRPESRIATLKALLGGEAPDAFAVHQALLLGFATQLGIEPRQGMPTETEEALARQHLAAEIGTDAFIEWIDDPSGTGVLSGLYAAPGGTIAAHVEVEGQGAALRIREVLFAGDFVVVPPRALYDLEAGLRGVGLAEAGAAVEALLTAKPPSLASVAPADFRHALEFALQRA